MKKAKKEGVMMISGLVEERKGPEIYPEKREKNLQGKEKKMKKN